MISRFLSRTNSLLRIRSNNTPTKTISSATKPRKQYNTISVVKEQSSSNKSASIKHSVSSVEEEASMENKFPSLRQRRLKHASNLEKTESNTSLDSTSSLSYPRVSDFSYGLLKSEEIFTIINSSLSAVDKKTTASVHTIYSELQNMDAEDSIWKNPIIMRELKKSIPKLTKTIDFLFSLSDTLSLLIPILDEKKTTDKIPIWLFSHLDLQKQQMNSEYSTATKKMEQTATEEKENSLMHTTLQNLFSRNRNSLRAYFGISPKIYIKTIYEKLTLYFLLSCAPQNYVITETFLAELASEIKQDIITIHRKFLAKSNQSLNSFIDKRNKYPRCYGHTLPVKPFEILMQGNILPNSSIFLNPKGGGLCFLLSTTMAFFVEKYGLNIAKEKMKELYDEIHLLSMLPDSEAAQYYNTLESMNSHLQKEMKIPIEYTSKQNEKSFKVVIPYYSFPNKKLYKKNECMKLSSTEACKLLFDSSFCLTTKKILMESKDTCLNVTKENVYNDLTKEFEIKSLKIFDDDSNLLVEGSYDVCKEFLSTHYSDTKFRFFGKVNENTAIYTMPPTHYFKNSTIYTKNNSSILSPTEIATLFFNPNFAPEHTSFLLGMNEHIIQACRRIQYDEKKQKNIILMDIFDSNYGFFTTDSKSFCKNFLFEIDKTSTWQIMLPKLDLVEAYAVEKNTIMKDLFEINIFGNEGMKNTIPTESDRFDIDRKNNLKNIDVGNKEVFATRLYSLQENLYNINAISLLKSGDKIVPILPNGTRLTIEEFNALRTNSDINYIVEQIKPILEKLFYSVMMLSPAKENHHPIDKVRAKLLESIIDVTKSITDLENSRGVVLSPAVQDIKIKLPTRAIEKLNARLYIPKQQ